MELVSRMGLLRRIASTSREFPDDATETSTTGCCVFRGSDGNYGTPTSDGLESIMLLPCWQ